MNPAFAYAFLVPLFPALGFGVLGLGGKALGKRHGWLAVAFEGGALATGLWVAFAEATVASPSYHDVSFVWLSLPNGWIFDMGTLVSPLGALMLVVVNVVGFLVVLYSNEYMAHEDGLPRYYAELMLFLTAMNALVLADNYLEFILFWELVGVCSYLLVGFFWRKPEAAAAAKKAFLVTRVGDVMFFLGVFVFFSAFADVNVVVPVAGQSLASCAGVAARSTTTATWASTGFAFVAPNASSCAPLLPSLSSLVAAGHLSETLATLGGILILGGAVGKSAQFPLHTWLPDAMEGPTTVSALIHAATMVAAGIYLLAITSIFVGFTLDTSYVILAIGAFTSLFAGTMGLVATDIKRVVAYSTISQLGYMAMGVGAASVLVALSPGATNQSGVAMFHLFTHAFFKALLFLTAGAVIHAVGTQDLFKMGGLRKAMPLTAGTMLVGALALSGIPPFAGFFSKDDVLGLTYSAATAPGSASWLLVFFALSLAGVFLTALYIFRLWFLVFSGERSRDLPSDASHASTSSAPAAASPAGKADAHGAAPAEPKAHTPAGPHDPSWVMAGPCLVLAALACVAGFLPLLPGVSHLFPGLTWGALGFSVSGGKVSFAASALLVSGLSLGLAVAGIAVAFALWGNGKVYRLPTGSPLVPVHTVLLRKYYVDEAYDAFARTAFLGLARCMDWVDRYVIDGTVRGIEEVFSSLSKSGRRLQTGVVSSYASWIVVGLLCFLVFLLLIVPWYAGGEHLPAVWGGL